jgi:hypothetical protein
VAAAGGPILIPSLRRTVVIHIEALLAHRHCLFRTVSEDTMLDLVFIAAGLGGFALMGIYAALCARL